MGEIHVVYRPVKIAFACPVSPAYGTAEQIEDRRFVECRETFDAIPKTRRDQRRVVGEPCHRLPIHPSAEILQRLWQVPVIQAQPWFDIGGQQPIDQPIVKREARFVHRPSTLR